MSISGSNSTRLHACCRRAASSRATALLAALLLLPTALLAQLPYATDPLFQGGRFEPDAHAVTLEQGNQGSIARSVARIGETDFLIQASLVKHPSGNQSNGYWNLGLMRFGMNTGNRFAWSNPTGNFAHFNNEYLIFPNVATASYIEILALRVVGDDILVLADVWTSSGGRDVRIVRFSLTGQYRGFIEVFNSVAEEYAGDMISYRSGLIGDDGGDQIVVVGASLVGGVSTPVFRRYQLTDDGAFIARTGVVQLDGSGCRGATDCRPRKLALGFRGLFAAPAIFIAGRIPNPDWKTTIMRVNTNGISDVSWNPQNQVLNFGDDEAPVGLAVRTSGSGTPGSPYVDRAYVAMMVDRGCTPGVNVASVRSGFNIVFFTTFGGSAPSGGVCLLGAESYYPRALSLNGSQLAIVGRVDRPSFLIGGSTRINSFLALLDADQLTLGFPQTAEVQDIEWPIGGPRQRHSVLNDVIATPGDTLIAVGDIRYTDAASVPAALRNKVQSGRVKFRRLTTDLFADGFE